MYEPKVLTCHDCGATFTWTAGGQEFHATKGFDHPPPRCESCREKMRQARWTRPRTFYQITCSKCAKSGEVPFEPRDSTTILCRDCFGKERSKGSIQGTGYETPLEIVTFIDTKFVEYLRKHPEEMYCLTPRQFEQLIADLFAGFGFNVELTSKTRDGGRDVIAIGRDIVEVKYVIECKRYAKKNKVGVNIIRELHGTTVRERATKGVLATTGKFSSSAHEWLEDAKWLLEGRDFDGVVEWLQLYRNLRIKE